MLGTLQIPAEFTRATENDTRAHFESMDVDTSDIVDHRSIEVRANAMTDAIKGTNDVEYDAGSFEPILSGSTFFYS